MNKAAFTLIVCFLINYNFVFGQEYSLFELKAGVGLEQGLNIGLNTYYLKNANAGIGIGSQFPSKDSTGHFLVFAENNFNIPLRRTRRLRPFFLFNQQVMYWKYTEPDFAHSAITLALNIGARIEFLNEYGFIFEVGPAITYTVKFDPEPGSTTTPITNKIQENFRVLFFQRF